MTNFKPTWELTKILIALEEAGLPEYREVSAWHLGWTVNNGVVYFIFHNYQIKTSIFDKSYVYDHNSLPEAILKLKELIDG